MDRGKQIAAGLVDFVPHPPSRLDAYAYLAEPMEMTFGRFHFRVEKEGSYRVEIPNSSGSSAVDSDFSSYASSTESGEEETSATRYVSTRAREKLAKIFNDMSFESSADSYISDGSSDVDSYDFIDKSITVGKVFINLNDDVTKPNIDLSTKYHQIYAIEDQEETSEAFDDLGNPYVDPSNLRQGLGNKYVGPEPRDRVQLSQAAWDRAARAMNGTEPMATTATPEELQAYQYRLARAARELEKQTAELNRRKEAASASSRRRADLSRQSRTSGDSHREARNRARSRLQHIPEAEREHLVQNLDMSFMSIDTRGNIIPKTPEAGYMATHAFILASKPPPGDPRETLYNMAVAGVGAMGTAFVSTPPEGAARQNSPRPAAATAAAPEGPSGARDTAAQARVDRARQSRRDHRQSPELNDEDMCGLPCFTRRVRKTRVPSGFKLPDNFKKFDGLQDPEDWLVDYLETVKLTGGTRATAMQSIQVHLSGAARSWIKKLTPGSIDSWESFEDVFVKNFRSTCKKPASLEELRACRQKPDEPMRKYIQRWNIIKNSAENISDERAIDAFVAGIRRGDFVEDLGRTNPKTVSALMEIANRWADGEDAVHNKRHSMMAYKEVYNELEKLFDGCEVNHISRLSNDEADVLANIGSQCLAVPPGVFWEEITERSTKSTKSKKKEKKPSGATKEKQEEEEEDQDLVMVIQIPWMQTYISYILRKEIPDDPVEARRVIRRSKAFTVVKGELYKRSISGVLQRCVTPEEGRIILKDVHEGICGHHASSRAIAAKVFRAGFYWLTAIEDAKDIVRTCDACQRIKDKKTGVEEPNPWNVAQLRRFYA
ncbi:hypothetical protein QYE76_021967 [Lolium multiflorum]|uniref:Retrotransposon gag domain-containing protein n=1 Tax=Lolium multiflorum TaxID=4521 RepID=A0AAD8R931_LOLMU|nr:hypothetical protein QYE76_021967 [Lolium multiflorum]